MRAGERAAASCSVCASAAVLFECVECIKQQPLHLEAKGPSFCGASCYMAHFSSGHRSGKRSSSGSASPSSGSSTPSSPLSSPQHFHPMAHLVGQYSHGHAAPRYIPSQQLLQRPHDAGLPHHQQQQHQHHQHQGRRSR